MRSEEWTQIADWYDAKIGDEGDLWHRYLIDPGLLEVIGPVRGLRVLDLACGNGYLSRRFARDGAVEVVGIDLSDAIVAHARRREAEHPLGIRYEIRDAGHLGGLADGAFDLVVANMALMDIENAADATKEASRVLRRGGRFVFSICHPCFDLNDRSMWVVERVAFENTVWRKVSGYRNEDTQRARWRIGENEFRSTRTYHRTLATYARYLREAGFVITRMEEPSPQPRMLSGSPQGAWISEIPLHLVYEAVKVPDLPAGPGRSARRRAWRRSGRSRRRVGRRSGSRGGRRGIGSPRRGSSPGS